MHQLQRLLIQNRNKSEIRHINFSGSLVSDLYLIGPIVGDVNCAEEYGGISPEAFAMALNSITTPEINLRINSPGGSYFSARMMEQTIKNHPSKINAIVEGCAASAMSYVALACDTVKMAPSAFFMIHRAMTESFGNADDLLKTVDLLNKTDLALVQTFSESTGQSPDQIKEWMAAETWFTAAEAVKYGFADSIVENPIKNTTQWDLSAYANAPKPIEQPKAPEVSNKESPPEDQREHLARRFQMSLRAA